MTLECDPQCPPDSHEKCVDAYKAWVRTILQHAERPSDLPVDEQLVIAGELKADAVDTLAGVAAVALHCTFLHNLTAVEYRLDQLIAAAEPVDGPD